METEDGVGRNLLDDMPPINCDLFEGPYGGSNDIGDMTFCLGNYVPDFMKMLFTMRSHHMLTDVVLEVGNELFHVHKVVLAAGSPYFKAMFTSGLKECEMSRVRLQGVCPSAMAWLVYFMYTGKVRITEVTVCQLLPAATMFQISNVIDACCAFLERQLDPSNAIGIANFAEQHGCADLKQKANQFIERHFTQVCQEEEFLQLTAQELICLIRKDELNVREEREVYNAVLSWVKFDEDRRYPRMEHILQAVRCQYLTPSFLKEQMSTCSVLKKVPACREYLAKIFKDLTLHKKPVVKERRPNTPRIIYVAGGYFRHSIDVFEAFNIDDNCWITLPRLTVPRSGLGAAFLKGMFYAVGGRNTSPGSSYDSDWVDVYSPAGEHWRPCSPMATPRHRVGVAVMDGLLYAVGGSAGTEYHKTVECYDPEKDAWAYVASMGRARLGVGVAVVNRLLYAVGGFDGARRTNSVECYHPENNCWSEVAPMHYARSGAGIPSSTLLRRGGDEPVHLRGGRLRRRGAAGHRRALRHGAQHVGGGGARARRALRAVAGRAGREAVRHGRLRRHRLPGRGGDLRAGEQHVAQRHAAVVGALGARVGRLLPARGAARGRARARRHARRAARQQHHQHAGQRAAPWRHLAPPPGLCRHLGTPSDDTAKRTGGSRAVTTPRCDEL
ncbi:kelch-like ECH-associated protein 1B isoform X2 [Nymphalis io]|nr:kelch-like ECH-associated protein 1B isoform X2 [Nymphalis io]